MSAKYKQLEVREITNSNPMDEIVALVNFAYEVIEWGYRAADELDLYGNYTGFEEEEIINFIHDDMEANGKDVFASRKRKVDALHKHMKTMSGLSAAFEDMTKKHKWGDLQDFSGSL